MEVGFHIRLKTDELQPYELESILKNLSSCHTDYITKEKVYIDYYWMNEDKSIVQIPGCFPIPIPESAKYVYDEGQPLKPTAKMKDGFTYREGQEQSIMDAMSENILTLMKPPGSGKTIIGSSVILKRKVRSLIIVDQDNLREQWINALNLVSDKTIDIYTDGLNFDMNEKEMNHDVYVCTIQGIIAKIRKYGLEYVRENFSKYGIGHLLLDEVHCLVGPEKFSLVCHIMNPKYVLALSATPKDDIYVKYWLGNIVVGDKTYTVNPTIVCLDWNSNMGYSKSYVTWGNRFAKDKYAKILYKGRTDKRTKKEIVATYPSFIASLAYKCFLNNRNILIICNFNELGVDVIIDELKHYVDESKIARYVAGCNREEESKKPIIVSNYKMLQKGTDIPTLDTLIMADPCANTTGLEQTIGRILRVNKGVDKKELLVIDVNDCNFGDAFLRWKKIRMDFYFDKKFIVEE